MLLIDSDPPASDLDAWYKPKRRQHFDREVGLERARRLVDDPLAVARHPFLPFMTFDIVRKVWSKDAETGKRRPEKKERGVAYAGHLDAHVFAAYAHRLKPLYEARLREVGLTDAVLAYRQVGNRSSNIHFAESVFRGIQELGNCEAHALDVTKFFDNLDHALLKRRWADLLGVEKLPEDHYAVYRHITAWSKMDRDRCFRRMGISKRQQRKWRGPLGDVRDFRCQVRPNLRGEEPLVVKHPDPRGIPQGSAISAFLSNLYMLPLDTELNAAATEAGGFYRRYSDDLMVVAPPGEALQLQERVKAALQALKLDLNEDKTHVSCFPPTVTGGMTKDPPLQYLGFEFDGQRMRIRSATLARAHQRRKRSVRTASRAARAAARRGRTSKIRRTKLYTKYTRLGAGRDTPKLPKRQQRTNFFDYADRSSRIHKLPRPCRQMRRWWSLLHQEIAEAQAALPPATEPSTGD